MIVTTLKNIVNDYNEKSSLKFETSQIISALSSSLAISKFFDLKFSMTAMLSVTTLSGIFVGKSICLFLASFFHFSFSCSKDFMYSQPSLVIFSILALYQIQIL